MDPTAYRVPLESLRWRCDESRFTFDCTDQLAPPQEFIGQDRAIKAIDFGLALDKPGFNIFVTGLTGTGKMSVIKAHLQKVVALRQERGNKIPVYDWCYVHNFATPDRPQALKLPRGKGRELRTDLEGLLADLRTDIARGFAGEEYETQRKQLTEEGQAGRQRLMHELEQEGQRQGFALQFTPMGVMVVPLTPEGRPLSQEDYVQLPEDTKTLIEERRTALMKRVEETFEKGHAAEKETQDKVKQLEQKIVEFAIARPFDKVTARYRELPEVAQHLDGVRAFTLNNVDLFRTQETPQPHSPDERAPRPPDLSLVFQVNVFVDNSETAGPPVVVETNPTYGNLFGKLERRAFMGAYFSDHTMVKAGTVSQANGGYLIVNARDLLLSPGVWEGLKRIIKNKELRIEDPLEIYGFIAPLGLRPQPIPTEVKVIVTGDLNLYQLLSQHDEDFWEMFKIKADFDFQIERSDDNVQSYACLISSICQQEGIRHFDRSGVARVVEYGARLVADQRKLSSRFGLIRDLLVEADQWSRMGGDEPVTGDHVLKAVEAKVYRSDLIAQRMQELIRQGTIMVDTTGEVVGQVNGLAVYDLGDFSFGRPSRITAKTFLGRRGVINIERESQLSGRIHDKGVLILSGFLGWKYAQDKPLSLSASICFEQSYEGVEGDSASSAELYAIISSLAEVPVKQSFAITGSVNQKGEVQPIGGVNEKVEGFFDVCRAQGLTGEQGVIIPHQNVPNLMLREDVVAAVQGGQFHVWAVKTIDEGIALLTGREAGEKGPEGSYPEGTLNYLVDKRLRQMALALKGFGPEPTA